MKQQPQKTGYYAEPQLTLNSLPAFISPSNTQSFNRYSYCWNNPLIYTDPSGEIILLYPLIGTQTGYDIQKFFLPYAIKINFQFGNQSGIVMQFSVGGPQVLPFSYRSDGSACYYKKNGEMSSGWQFTNGYEIGLGPFLTVGSTNYSTPANSEFNQRTGHARIGIPGFNIKYENDGVMWFLGDGGDRYRTAAAQMQIGIFSVGINLFTGDPGMNKKDRKSPIDPLTGKPTYVSGNSDDYRAGIGYIGIGPFRFGNDKESRRHRIQNEIIHGDKYPWFKYDQTRKDKFYFQFGTGGGYLW